MSGKRREWLSLQDYKKKARSFLLPLLETSLIHINNDNDYLIDICFIQIGFPQIVLIFDNIDYEPLKMDIYKLTSNSLFIDADYGDDEKEISLFFDIPKEYKKDFELFVQGKYTEFSEKYKELLTKVYGTTRLTGISQSTNLPNVGMYDVLYPTKTTKRLLADQLNVNASLIKEVLDPPNIELETYKTVDEL